MGRRHSWEGFWAPVRRGQGGSVDRSPVGAWIDSPGDVGFGGSGGRVIFALVWLIAPELSVRRRPWLEIGHGAVVLGSG